MLSVKFKVKPQMIYQRQLFTFWQAQMATLYFLSQRYNVTIKKHSNLNVFIKVSFIPVVAKKDGIEAITQKSFIKVVKPKLTPEVFVRLKHNSHLSDNSNSPIFCLGIVFTAAKIEPYSAQCSL